MQPQTANDHDTTQLRGTILMVILIGGIILVVWVGIFVLFLSRS